MRILSGIATLALAWVIGLFLFISKLPEPGLADHAANRTAGAPGGPGGIVVFTGQGGPRIASAMSLFDEGAGERLLISGVNPEISRTRLAELWPGEPETFDCCVDLGWQAQSTTGNAAELREWASSHGFGSLILVTSDYHMPRALLEARASVPGVDVTPFTVASGYLDDRGRPASFADFNNLSVEFSKYLAVRAKTLVK